VTAGYGEFTVAEATFANAGSATSDDDLYVSDPGSGELLEFTPDGKQTSLTTIFNRNGLIPLGVAVDSGGNVFVSNERPPVGIGGIHKFTPARMLTKFATGLRNPISLAFDSAGNLFESDLGSGRILQFTPDGKQSTFASALSFPAGLAFDCAGNLFADDSSGRIFEFSPDGTRTIFASGLLTPAGLAFDSAGNLFEADLGSGRILQFTPDGMQTTFASGLKNPLFLAFGPASAPVPDNGATVLLLGISALRLLWVHRIVRV
jgi:DNA-binding beta-propeller fold protein YncE